MKIKTIGFDFFGTLVEAEGEWEECILSICDLLQRKGYQISDDAFLSNYKVVAGEKRNIRYNDLREVGSRILVAETLNRLGYEADPFSRDISMATDRYFSLWKITLASDATLVLEELSKNFGIILVTNFTHTPFVNQSLQNLGIKKFFNHIITSEGFGWRKPHPKIFEHVLELVGTKPEETIFIGDDLVTDIKGAKGLGIKTVHLVDREDSAEKKHDIRIYPDHRVSSLTQVLELVTKEYL
jgi:FMN phosphatase YigB (HAD superfamily)